MMKMNLTLFGETIHHALDPNQSNRKMTLTVKELAEELNISRNTAYQLADQKDFRLSGLVGGCSSTAPCFKNG
jgi:HTH domain